MHYILQMTLTDYMYQEEKEEVDLPALKTALTHQYNDPRTTLRTDHSHQKHY